MGFDGICPLVNRQKTAGNHHGINGKSHYFECASFNIYVKLPEGIYVILIHVPLFFEESGGLT